MNTSCDVLVIGAGPAGLTAAARAAESGASVTVVDDNPAAGGQIWRGGLIPERFRARTVKTITNAGVIWGDARRNTVLIETLHGPAEVRWQRLIIATGARELFLPFRGWTLPGVTGPGGLQALVKSGAPVKGRRIVVAGSGPLLLAVAAYLRKRGAHISLIAEQASFAALRMFVRSLSPNRLLQAAMLRLALAGVSYRTGCWVEASEGRDRVERVRVRSGDQTWTEACDYAAVAYGLEPNTEFASLLGCRLGEHGVDVDDFQRTSISGVLSAGECTGIGGLDVSLAEGAIAGYMATDDTQSAERLLSQRSRAKRFADALNTAFRLRSEVMRLATPETIICRCEDVTLGRLQAFPSSRAAKLHTRCGMGPCQGRICGTATKYLFGWKPGSVRPPVFPATVETLTGGSDNFNDDAMARSDPGNHNTV